MIQSKDLTSCNFLFMSYCVEVTLSNWKEDFHEGLWYVFRYTHDHGETYHIIGHLGHYVTKGIHKTLAQALITS